MKITVESTTKIVELRLPGSSAVVPARIWEGKTETGIPVHVFITRIAVDKTADATQFERELQQCRVPENTDIQAYPLRMIL